MPSRLVSPSSKPSDWSFRRPAYAAVLRRLKEPRRFIQVLAGPRQIGKTTLIRQVCEALTIPTHYASADDPTGQDRGWLRAQWDLGRLRATERAGRGTQGALLVLDEAHKVPAWSEIVKQLWDEDTAGQVPLRVVLLGSAPLLVQKGTGDSLTGRFELLHLSHWSLDEMHDAFGWDPDTYLFFGGYPGAAPLTNDPPRWRNYIRDSFMETTLARDILLMSRVDKPALLRQLFHLACDYSAQVLSYTKMLGRLQDAGNTTTLSHYLELLAGAGLACGLQKFPGSRVQQRSSIPKLLVLNTALMTAMHPLNPTEARENHDLWGRLTESAVGAHLVNAAPENGTHVFYWREHNREVDFVVQRGADVVAIEVTSSRRRDALPGLDAFAAQFSPRRRLLVGGQGIPVEEFLATPVDRWLR